MSRLRSSILAVAVGLCALSPSIAFAADPVATAHAKSNKNCRGFRAVGSGLNESIASLMATQGAINLAENRGWTVVGDAKLEGCKSTGMFGTECSATSYACKLPQ
ncbi:MAG: hypothetical protein WDN31_04605 [Hyphomicrobium sp.]